MDIEDIIAKENIDELENFLNDKNYKVGPQRIIMKKIAKSKWDITSFKIYSSRLKWFWYNISLLRCKDFDETMDFINNNLDYYHSWYSVDGSLMFINRKKMTFEKIYKYASKYVYDEREFVSRLGYILLFMCDFKDEEIYEIEKLFHDDDKYYVQMAEAWLMCELVVKNPKCGYIVIERSPLKYNILSKAIQKCQDSFRIDDEIKNNLKALRESKKKN